MTKPATFQHPNSAVPYSRNTWIKGLNRPYASSAPSSYQNILNLIIGPYCLFSPAHKSWKLPEQVKCTAALNLHCTALCRRRNASKAKDMVEMDELWSLGGVSPFYHHSPRTNQPEHLKVCKANLCFTPITGAHHSTAPQNQRKWSQLCLDTQALHWLCSRYFTYFTPQKADTVDVNQASCLHFIVQKTWHSQSSDTGAWALLSTEITTAKEATLTFLPRHAASTPQL